MCVCANVCVCVCLYIYILSQAKSGPGGMWDYEAAVERRQVLSPFLLLPLLPHSTLSLMHFDQSGLTSGSDHAFHLCFSPPPYVPRQCN